MKPYSPIFNGFLPPQFPAGRARARSLQTTLQARRIFYWKGAFSDISQHLQIRVLLDFKDTESVECLIFFWILLYR